MTAPATVWRECVSREARGGMEPPPSSSLQSELRGGNRNAPSIERPSEPLSPAQCRPATAPPLPALTRQVSRRVIPPKLPRRSGVGGFFEECRRHAAGVRVWKRGGFSPVATPAAVVQTPRRDSHKGERHEQSCHAG